MQIIKSKNNKKHALIYEVNLTIDNEVVDEFDAWLQKHVDEMLAIPGFISASTAVIENNDEHTKQRCVQYRITDQQALDAYFEKDAERMRARGLEKFSNQMTVVRRILTPSQAALAEEAACANCGTQLEGRFCSSCGQREEPRVPTFMAMSREVINAMFGLESKLWQSIYFLIFKPGHLTVAYLSGQRQKFTTPFRLFLLFSIVTFAYVTFLSTQSLVNVSINDIPALEQDTQEETGSTEKKARLNFNVGEHSGLFSKEKDQEIEKLMQNAYEQISTDLKNGKTDKVVEQFIQPLPKALLLFLPFIALACKIIYIGRGKYYVEHLIYLLHNHSFLFATLLLTVVIVQLSKFYPYLEYPIAILINLFFVFYAAEYYINKIKSNYPERKVKALFNTAFLVLIVYLIYQFTRQEGMGAAFTLLWAFYVPYYLYRSMRNVYQSSRFVTIVSYSLIAFVYLVLFTIMLTITIIYSGYTYA